MFYFLLAYFPGKDSGKEHGSRRAKKKVWSKVEVAAVMQPPIKIRYVKENRLQKMSAVTVSR